MKLVFDKNGRIELAQNGAIKPQWSNAWDGDLEIRPDRAAKVQTIRLAEPARRPVNPLFILEWFSNATGDFRNQLSYFFALGRTNREHKDSVRKSLACIPAGLFVLGLLVVLAINCQHTQVTGAPVVAEATVDNDKAEEAAENDSAEETAVEGEPAPSTVGQAPFILPAPPEATEAEVDASGAVPAPTNDQSETGSNPAPSINISALSL